MILISISNTNLTGHFPSKMMQTSS